MPAAAWLMNLGFAGGTAAVVATTPAKDKGKDAGHGKPWWELEYYLPPSRPKTKEEPVAAFEQVKEEVDAVVDELPADDRDFLAEGLARIERRVVRLSEDAEDVRRKQVKTREIQAIARERRQVLVQIDQYRRELSDMLAGLRFEAHKERLRRDDEDLLRLIQTIL